MCVIRRISMIRTSIINLLRSLLITVIAALGAMLLTMIVILIAEVFTDHLPLWVLLIPSVIAAALIAFGGCGITIAVHRTPKISGYWMRRIEKGKPMKERTVKIILLLHLLLAAAGLAFLILVWRKYQSGISFEGDTATTEIAITVFVAAVSVAVTQFFYYFFIAFIYYGSMGCEKCKHIFCVTSEETGYSTASSKQYKTGTERMQIGSIHRNDLLDTKVAEVYGDVATTYSRDVKHTTTHYGCHCVICGHEWSGSYSYTTKSSWK